jgi:uncharacterized repeat protein (TIGR01451 family)
MQVRRLLAVIVAVGAVLAAASPASAHPSPGNCLANGIDLTLGKNAQVLRQGDTIRFLIGVQNTNTAFGLPCDVTGASALIYLPTARGLYNLAAPSATVVSSQAFPSGALFRQVGAYDWVVNLDPDVTFAYARAQISGTLHDTDPDHTFADIVKDIGFTVTNPKLTLSKIGSIQAGQAPQNVTYTYLVRNDSTTAVPMDRVTVSDDICQGPTYVGGDNGDNVLSNNETWTYTCSMLHQAPGVYTNTANACAYSKVPGDTTRPVCAPPAKWTVTLTGPPPQVAVKPVSVSQAPCTLARVNSTTVRARQLNTIKVRARNLPAGTTLTLTLPGGKKVTAKTDKNLVATFRVRPTKTGTARVSSGDCTDIERLSIKPARRVVAQRAPRVTG